MLLKFADSKTTEYVNGSFHKKNDGEPFEVSDLLGGELLTAVTKKEGETVPVFKKYDRKASKSTLPDEFPMRAELEANNIFTMQDVAALTIESHKNLEGIGKTTMQRILDARDSFTDEVVIVENEGEQI